MGDNLSEICSVRTLPLGTASSASLSVAAIGGLLVLAPVSAYAQWWRSAPADFEDCAAAAEKAPTKEEKTSRLSECNAKFAGRRKPGGGGYTYYDFMQNRNFDIAGPNPTPEEQKKIDEAYIGYLERERRSNVAAALAAKHDEKQRQQLQQVSLRADEKVPVPVASPAKQPSPARTRSLSAGCPKGTFSCEWPRLSAGINDLKRLFGGAPPKDKDKGKKS